MESELRNCSIIDSVSVSRFWIPCFSAAVLGKDQIRKQIMNKWKERFIQNKSFSNKPSTLRNCRKATTIPVSSIKMSSWGEWFSKSALNWACRSSLRWAAIFLTCGQSEAIVRVGEGKISSISNFYTDPLVSESKSVKCPTQYGNIKLSQLFPVLLKQADVTVALWVSPPLWCIPHDGEVLSYRQVDQLFLLKHFLSIPIFSR